MISNNHKPFPSRVRWLAIWCHRWTLLNMLNQVAYGSWSDIRTVVENYGGTNRFADDLYAAAREVIEVTDD